MPTEQNVGMPASFQTAPSPKVMFGQRTASGRYISYSRDELEGEPANANLSSYLVQFPMTPDNQPMEFVTLVPAATANSSACAANGCGREVMRNERGEETLPCRCAFKLCRNCFEEAIKNGSGLCPGCKKPYEVADMEAAARMAKEKVVLRAPAENAREWKEKRFSMASGAAGEVDYSRLLFETKGTYGIGSAIRAEEHEEGDDDDAGKWKELTRKSWRPLTRKVQIPAAILSPYRLLIAIRAIVLALFLTWRISHRNPDAIWLWGISVVCELWFVFSWFLDQLPKLFPVNRAVDLSVLKDKFEAPSPSNPTAKSDLPGIDVFVTTADPDKEPPLVTANTILSILAADYPAEKLACYISDDGGALFTFEAMTEAASFAAVWTPFCRKHRIEPRNPESYFSLRRDPYKNKARPDFVRDRRRIKREYDEFKVRINGLPERIRRRSDAFHSREELNAAGLHDGKVATSEEPSVNIPKATWMADGTHWPGTWTSPAPANSSGDHPGIIQVMIRPQTDHPVVDANGASAVLDLTEIDIKLPMLVYVSREKRLGCSHNNKAGAMNALARASAIISNGPFILNLDCNHYFHNSKALREAMCFMMDRSGDGVCYVQFPQRFEEVDPSDRFADQNTVFFDVNMRALDGLQGPLYTGTGCLFRRIALYGFDPPRAKHHFFPHSRAASASDCSFSIPLDGEDETSIPISSANMFGNSTYLLDSIPVAEYQGRPLADHPSVKNGRPSGLLTIPRDKLDASMVAEAVSVVSCWYEDKTEWGNQIGWIYGSAAGNLVTGYLMHNRGWRSIYCSAKRDAFRCTASVNLTDRLLQVLRLATGSVQILFSRNNPLLASLKMKLLQRTAYLNVAMHPFTSIFLITYCLLPALSLISGQFVVQSLNVTFLAYFLVIALTFCLLTVLEIRWSGIELEEWWRNEQFWLISGTSANFAGVLQGMLSVVARIDTSYTVSSKPVGSDKDEVADVYAARWTWLMIPPLTIIMVNIIAIAVGVSRTIYSVIPQWSRLLGGVMFSVWVLAHLYPFAKGWLMGRRGRIPTIVFVWSGLIAITASLLWVAINPPSANSQIGGPFSLFT